MFIILGNGQNGLSSNLGQGYVCFTFALIPLWKAWICLFSLQLWVMARQTGSFSLGTAIGLGKTVFKPTVLHLKIDFVPPPSWLCQRGRVNTYRCKKKSFTFNIILMYLDYVGSFLCHYWFLCDSRNGNWDFCTNFTIYLNTLYFVYMLQKSFAANKTFIR